MLPCGDEIERYCGVANIIEVFHVVGVEKGIVCWRLPPVGGLRVRVYILSSVMGRVNGKQRPRYPEMVFVAAGGGPQRRYGGVASPGSTKGWSSPVSRFCLWLECG